MIGSEGFCMFKLDKQQFFDQFRPWYKKKTKKKTLSVQTANGVDFLLDQFANSPVWKDIRHVAYAMATIAHETAWTFLPIKEYRAKKGSRGYNNQNRYWLSGYYGRGYVQLTWDYNYIKAGKKLGQPLATNPALALRNDIAFQILTYGMHEGWFTGKKLSDYINAKTKDYKNARRIINGLDKWQAIQGYAIELEAMLKEALILENEAPRLVDRTSSSDPVLEPVGGDEEVEMPSENPVDGVAEGQEPAQDVEEGDVKPGEAAPEQPAQQGEAVVGGRPDDPPVIVETPQEESISGWRTWPTTIWGTLSGAGLTVGGIVTTVTGIELTPVTQIIVGIIIILGILFAGAFGLFYLYTRMKGTMAEKERKHQIHLKELEMASRPDRYNIKSVG
jgi:hypothetical protein